MLSFHISVNNVRKSFQIKTSSKVSPSRSLCLNSVLHSKGVCAYIPTHFWKHILEILLNGVTFLSLLIDLTEKSEEESYEKVSKLKHLKCPHFMLLMLKIFAFNVNFLRILTSELFVLTIYPWVEGKVPKNEPPHSPPFGFSSDNFSTSNFQVQTF